MYCRSALPTITRWRIEIPAGDRWTRRETRHLAPDLHSMAYDSNVVGSFYSVERILKVGKFSWAIRGNSSSDLFDELVLRP